MPGLSGLELLRRMKAEASIRDVPVVMLTGLGDRELKRKALQLGAADLLNKPAEAEDLTARITAIVDVFDALTSRRPYKPPFSDETAVSIIADEAGAHFDHDVHRAFEQSLPELRIIRKRRGDQFSDPQEDFRDAPHLVRG